MPDHEVVLLAALIADGNLTERTPRFCSAPGLRGPARRRAGRRRARAAPPRRRRRDGDHQRRPRWPAEPAHRPAASATVCGACDRATKFVPDAVFGLGDEQIARFLSVLYACDGHVYCGERYSPDRLHDDLRAARRTTFSTCCSGSASSPAIRPLKRPSTRGPTTVAREVRITDRAGLEEFARRVAVVGKTPGSSASSTRSAGRAVNAELRHAPDRGVGARPRGQGRRARGPRSAPAAGRPRNHNWHVGTRGLSRPQLATLGRGDAQQRARRPRHERPLVGRGRVDRGPRASRRRTTSPSPASTTSSPTTSSSTTAR